MRGARFWITMAVFQVAFGLTVFALTRHYYLASAPPAPLPAWALGLGAALPSAPATPAGSFALAPPLSLPAVASASPPNNDPAAISQRADAAFTAGNYAEAAALYDQLLAIDPQHQRTWLTTGFVNLRLGNTTEARAALIKAGDVGDDKQIRDSAEKMLADLPQ
jgi:tetratricopeptide (TPR) repeat protein